MSNRKNGFVPIIILLGIIVASVAGGGVYYLKRSNISPTQPQPLLAITSSKRPQPSSTQIDMMKGAIDKLHVDLHRYYAENKSYPTKLDQLVGVYSADIIYVIPITDKSINYNPSPNRKSYVLKATLSNGETYGGDSEAQKKIFDSTIKLDIKQIQTALEMYFYDKKFYPSELDVLTPTYLSKLYKTNPYTFKDYDYKLSLDKKSYTLITELTNGQIYKVIKPN